MLPVLLFLPLLAGFAAGAAAQAPAANADGSYTVPHDWSLKPSNVRSGDRFRLLIATLNERDATATDISTYNSFVQFSVTQWGLDAIKPYSAQFRVVGSTATVDARDNTMTTGTGMPIYWLSGDKVADGYADFYDDSWDSTDGKNSRGLPESQVKWTGSTAAGIAFGVNHLGGVTLIRQGYLADGRSPLNDGFGLDSTVSNGFYGLSPVFVVGPIPVPAGWALRPADAPSGGQFRLLVKTARTRDATSTDIADYDSFVRGDLGWAEHDALSAYAGEFKAFGSTSAISAGRHNGLATTDTGTVSTWEDGSTAKGDAGIPIYWLGGNKVADNYFDFCDSNWTEDNFTANDPKNQRGENAGVTEPWTGTGNSCETWNHPLGNVTVSRGAGGGGHSNGPFHESAETNTELKPLYALSPVFTVTPVEVSLHAPDSIAVEDNNGNAMLELRLSGPLASGETLTVGYSLDLNATVTASGVTVSHNSGATSTGTVTITGPRTSTKVNLNVIAAANTVHGTKSGPSDRTASGIGTADFKLTSTSGITGAALTAESRVGVKLFVADTAAEFGNAVMLQVNGGQPPIASRTVAEGGRVTLLLPGNIGPRATPKGRSGGYQTVIGVQHLSTGFSDLGEVEAGYVNSDGNRLYTFTETVGRRTRDEAALTDYYPVYTWGGGRPGFFSISVKSDAADEGDEKFRIFIAKTPPGMKVGGIHNSLRNAPAVDFIIPGSGNPPASSSPSTPPPSAVEVPDTQVSNVQANIIDAASATVSWDAVEHATSYQVEWEGDGQQFSSAGAMPGITETTATINHQAQEAMTLTIKVIPAHVDGNGDTRLLDDLAGTATLDVAPAGSIDSDSAPSPDDQGLNAQDENPAPLKDYSELIATVQGYAAETHNGPDHVDRWMQVLAAFGDDNGYAAMTAAEAREMSKRFSSSRWDPVAAALTELEVEQAPEPVPIACVSPELQSDVEGYSEEDYGAAHVERWLRVLYTFAGTANDSTIMKAEEAKVMMETFSRNRWEPVYEAIKCLEEQAWRDALSN